MRQPSDARRSLPPGGSMSDHAIAAQQRTPPRKRDRSHLLYLAVIVAVLLGIAVGILWPAVGVALRPIGTAFVNLSKMLISPVIVCTIVLGIGSIRQAATVGKVGGLALGYFLVMSTVALIIGLVVGNILHPGSGLDLASGAKPPASDDTGTAAFLL